MLPTASGNARGGHQWGDVTSHFPLLKEWVPVPQNGCLAGGDLLPRSLKAALSDERSKLWEYGLAEKGLADPESVQKDNLEEYSVNLRSLRQKEDGMTLRLSLSLTSMGSNASPKS